MASVNISHTFISGTLAKSSEVNQNFQDLVTFLTTHAIQADASKAFTAVPSGPALDPTSDNQLVRRKYVDSGLQPWTPSWTNVVLGSGATNVGRYWKIGREVNFVAHLILGTGGDVTSNLFLSWAGQLPDAHSDFGANNMPVATAWADSANNRFGGVGIMSDGNNQRVGRFVSDGTNIAWDATQPFNWASGASISVAGKYLTV